MKKYLIFALLISVIGLLVGCNNKEETKMKTTDNKEKAVNVLRSLETGEKEAIEKWISPNQYIQHNLGFPSGREVLVGALDQLKQAGTKVNIQRVIVDGDFVALHTDYNFLDLKQDSIFLDLRMEKL